VRSPEDRERRDLKEALIALRGAIRLQTLTIVFASLALLAVIALPGIGAWWAARNARKAAPALTPAAKGTKRAVTVTRAAGGTIRTSLGYGLVVNAKSSMTREWIALHDPALPADLVGTPGVTTRHTDQYQYFGSFKLKVGEPLAAVEVRFVTFDVWGEHVRNLSSTEVVDMEPGEHDLSGAWQVYSENEVSEYYASIAYVARARTKTGRVVQADIAAVVAEAQKLSAKFSPEDLEPQKPKP
jgi:hypothetical protein